MLFLKVITGVGGLACTVTADEGSGNLGRAAALCRAVADRNAVFDCNRTLSLVDEADEAAGPATECGREAYVRETVGDFAAAFECAAEETAELRTCGGSAYSVAVGNFDAVRVAGNKTYVVVTAYLTYDSNVFDISRALADDTYVVVGLDCEVDESDVLDGGTRCLAEEALVVAGAFDVEVLHCVACAVECTCE